VTSDTHMAEEAHIPVFRSIFVVQDRWQIVRNQSAKVRDIKFIKVSDNEMGGVCAGCVSGTCAI
jgi:hypothetical protein